MDPPPEKKSLIVDDETFVSLIQLAREDSEMGQTLQGLLGLDDFNRKSLLGSWIEEARLRGAPEEFVRALGYLRDDDIARQARELLADGTGD